jgi:16S rRNA (guanine527-N7)-methyltransferase
MTPTLSEQAAALFDLHLTPEQDEQFEHYSRELALWNEQINLTAITEPEAVQVRHFLDSLSIVQAVKPYPGMRLIDVGTGAGFPGLPLAIVFAGIRVTLLEATGKKVAFLDHIVDLLGLKGVEPLHARAEEAGHMPKHRAGYDLVLARSVARLPSLVEYMLPLAKIGGRCIAMKGETAAAEAADSKRALSLLGGRLGSIEEVHLPGITEPHYLVVIDKVAPTPSPYPRKPGMPTKMPLV